MKNLLTAAVLALGLACSGFASTITGYIRAANVASVYAPMTDGSYVMGQSQAGLSLAQFDLDGGWSATLHVYQKLGPPTSISPWRQVPDSSIVAVSSGTAGAISSGATGHYQVLIGGEGQVAIASSAYSSGPVTVTLSIGVASATSGNLAGIPIAPTVPPGNFSTTDWTASNGSLPTSIRAIWIDISSGSSCILKTIESGVTVTRTFAQSCWLQAPAGCTIPITKIFSPANGSTGLVISAVYSG